jgi:uncharacterized protein involved in exopolysaccharide biosynthesis
MSHDPTAHPAAESVVSDAISFADIVSFFRRNLLLIGGAALAAGASTALVVVVLVSPRYESSATLVIVPPAVTSELRPAALSIQAYQQILESDAVIAEVRRKLVERGQFRPGDPLRLGRELETRIFVSRRAEETTLAPMLQAVARGETGEEAAAIANTWAEVFLERARELVAGTTASMVTSIDEQYPKARDNLAKIEDARVLEANALQKRFNEAATRWGGRITTFKVETSSLTGTFHAETRHLVEEFNGEHSLDNRKAQLAALRKAYGELQEEQARVTSLLQLKQLQLEAARRQLAETPQLLTLQKAITDDALWRSLADSKSGNADWKALQERSLATQEVNPVFTSLSAKLAEIEMDVNAMVPRATALTTDLERISAEMKVLESDVGMNEAELEKLTRGRESGLAKLTDERANMLSQLTRGRDEELDGIRREMETRLGQIDRDIDQQKGLFTQLAKSYNQALLAKGEQSIEDVRLGAPAVAPEWPLPRGSATKSLLAGFLGGLLGLGLALVRDSWG